MSISTRTGYWPAGRLISGAICGKIASGTLLLFFAVLLSGCGGSGSGSGGVTAGSYTGIWDFTITESLSIGVSTTDRTYEIPFRVDLDDQVRLNNARDSLCWFFQHSFMPIKRTGVVEYSNSGYQCEFHGDACDGRISVELFFTNDRVSGIGAEHYFCREGDDATVAWIFEGVRRR